MKLSLRFILPLVFVLGLITSLVMPFVEALTVTWFTRDLDMRSQVIANTMQEPLAELVQSSSNSKIVSYFNRVIQDERLFALGFCDKNGAIKYKTSTFPSEVDCQIGDSTLRAAGRIIKGSRGSLHIVAHEVTSGKNPLGELVLIHDMSFIDRRSQLTKTYLFYLFTGLAIIISLVTVVVAQLSWRGWVAGMRAILRGEGLVKPLSRIRNPELMPLAKDLRNLVKDLEHQKRSRDEGQMSWNPGALKDILKDELAGEEILIVSNREPYIHVKKNEKIEIQVPASGLVTALEPIMRACSGTWVAHGSGSGDRDVVDKFDRIRVPPEEPAYSIRRVWLTKEEEGGYYYGFSNEGLWPLCHIAHTRPIFRMSDWKQYVEVNKKFAEAVLQEAKTSSPVILIQDYHFALLPRMIRERLPDATIISFWHIPWPNPEAFGICPWREEILFGLLGSSIMGFHTRFHCNNFIDTVDRYLEARIDRDSFTVSFQGQLSAVKNYPISIEWPSRWLKTQKPVRECRDHIRKVNNLPSDIFLGIGVDRLDYTKGILERFMAIERFLEKNPDWIGKFSFVQIAAPTRTSIEQYQTFENEVRAMARKINDRFQRNGCMPIILKVEHHEPNQVFEYYRASDVCMVTSLHDGMNLVAKEFIAAREDNLGVLILSQFTGAARELPEALIVNPYNIEQCANALLIALTMDASEQKARMRSMRGLIQEFNVFRWAGRMLIDAARIRERNRLRAKIKETESNLKEQLDL